MTHANRGMLLESLLNKTITFYANQNIAVFHKKELPIKFNSINKENHKLALVSGLVINKSTVDYYGIYKSFFVAFEAKSVENDVLPLKNIAHHQNQYLKKIIFHQGLAFYIIYFKKNNRVFLLEANFLSKLKKKSIDVEFLNKYGYKLSIEFPGIIDFVSILKKIIENKNPFLSRGYLS